jgi:vacuolar-type H+-ATPase subunit H
MENVKFLLKRLRNAENSYKKIIEEATTDKKKFIDEVCFYLSSVYQRNIDEVRDCLGGADIEIEERGKLSQGRGIRVYPITILVPNEKWDKLCNLCDKGKVGGFSLIYNVINLNFVKHEYKNTSAPLHELMHSSFGAYRYRFGEPNSISYNLLNELNSYRVNVEHKEMSWSTGYPSVESTLIEWYLPRELKFYYKENDKETYDKIKDFNEEQIVIYLKDYGKAKLFYKFSDLIKNACSVMEELEKRYDKWIIDRFMIKCRGLEDVVSWERHKDWLDSRQSRIEKKDGPKLDKTMHKLEKEFLEEQEKELEEIEEEIREEDKTRKKIKRSSLRKIEEME